MSTSPAVTMWMSGTARVDLDGAPAEVKSRRERAVLARLIAADGHVVSTDRLIEDLWSGEPPPKALGGLQVHISNLRRILEPGRAPRSPARILVSEPPGYALRVPRDAVDLWRFADLVHAVDGDAATRHARLGDALTLWRGEPFGPHATDDWARAEVARYDELHLTAIEQRAAAALELGRPAEVVASLAGQCERHPAREELFRLVALAQYRLGRQADALHTLRTVREYLADELGVDPSPPVRELEAAILQQDPDLQLPAAPSAPVHRSEPAESLRTDIAHDPAFAGREAEIEKLLEHADTVRHTGLRVVWITAEAGGGKSTLTQLAVGRLRAAGWATAIGHCPEVEGAPTAWAWREIVGELGGDNELDDPFLIARQIRSACESGPADAGIVIALDDVHRADSATLQVLRQTVSWLADRPVLILATYRPSEARTELLATGASLVSATADLLALAGLSDDGIRALAADVGLDPVDDTTLALLRSRTDGNPLFVRELAKLVASRGTRDAQKTIPSGVREVLLRRVERLPDDTISVLRLLAVCGRRADIDALIALWPDASGAEDTVLDAIDTAVVAGLLTAEVDTVWFNHVLMRDAVYDGIPVLRRRRLHWRTFEFLQHRARSAADELAVHAALGAAGATGEQALEVVESAARHRSGDLAADSAELWQYAVDLHALAGHDRPTAPLADRSAMVHALGDLVTALAHRGEISLARSRRTDAVRLAEATGDQATVVSALTCWRTPTIWTTRTKGVPDEVMVDALDRALPTSTGADRVRLLVTAVFEHEGINEDRSYECARAAMDLADTLGDIELRCAALNGLVYASLGPDHRGDYPELVDTFLATAQEAGSLEYEAAARFFMFLARTRAIDPAGAAAEVQRAMACATSGRVGELVVVLSAFNAVLDVMRGRLEAAEQSYTVLAMQLSAAGLPSGEDFAQVGRLSVDWVRGSIEHVVDHAARWYERAPHSVAWIYVVALLDAGREDEARAIADTDPYVTRDYYWTTVEVFHARALVRLRMVDEARDLYAVLQNWSGVIAGFDSGSVTFGPVDVVLAELADLIGDPAAAQRHRDVAAELDAKVRRGLAQIDAG